MQPDDALARWGRHEELCRNAAMGADDACFCGLDAEIARQAEWARLAELVIEWDGTSSQLFYDKVRKCIAAVKQVRRTEMVALARRLQGEK